ncbi:MAG: hypothetical protein JO116_16300 [Planctomycetaceae bacterium]|nr:hypothetical protein [Planctomycetaceae bacterium]
MGVRRGIEWKGGVWGAVAGILFGLLILLVVTLVRDANITLVAHPASTTGTRSAGEPVGAGNVLTLADGEAGIGIPNGVSTRGRARLFLLAAHMTNNDYDKAVAVADEMDPGVDRDSGLQEIAEKIVPRDLTTNSDLIPKNNQEMRAEMIRQLRRLLQLAKQATGQDLRARLLVRTAIVKRSLDRENHVMASPEEVDLDPETLLTQVSRLAREIPPDSARSNTGMGLKILLTALLGKFGFAVTQMVQPVLQASGSIMAAEVARLIGSMNLTDRLVRIRNEVTGEGLIKPVPDPAREG